MAKSKSFGRSIDLGSDQVPDFFCEPCYDVQNIIKPAAGFCKNCNEDLCLECYTGHLRRKMFQNHKLVDKSTRPKKSARQVKPQKAGVECHLHPGETIQSFCHGHSQLCCKVCLTLNHLACQTEEIAKLARNIQDSKELQGIIKKLNTLKKGFNDNLSKTGANETVIQKNHSNAINEMKKLREEFEKLMTETESRADKVKEEDFNKIEKVAATCDILIPQINKLTTNLETLKENGEMERLFISMKNVESQLKTLEENLEKIETGNILRAYKFEPDARLKALFKDCKELGQFIFEKSCARIPEPKATIPSDQKKKRPLYLKDIIAKSSSDYDFTINDSLALPNKQILITDWNNSKLKLIDKNQDKIISELKLSGMPIAITSVKYNEVAVTIIGPPYKIQFVSVCDNFLSIGREISVDGECRGLTYNYRDQTLIVVYWSPAKVEILNMAGTVIKCLDKDSKGNNLFSNPSRIALSPTMTEMYVTDSGRDSVMCLTMNGDVKAEYKDKSVEGPEGICVHKSGLVYVVGYSSNSMHQLDTNSGEFKLLLNEKDGLNEPYSISYCELEDKLYIGMGNSTLKVYQTK